MCLGQRVSIYDVDRGGLECWFGEGAGGGSGSRGFTWLDRREEARVYLFTLTGALGPTDRDDSPDCPPSTDAASAAPRPVARMTSHGSTPNRNWLYQIVGNSEVSQQSIKAKYQTVPLTLLR